jgi:acetylornithine deacetylase/succinyl-diaminopimelate desuccinylase-like protein
MLDPSTVPAELHTILSAIDPAETTALAQTLVRIPSITGREGLAISRFITEWFTGVGIQSGLQEVGPERANVWARLAGEQEGPCLLLNGHLDTKPGEGMTIDPFSGEIHAGRLWGRGSCDMKGPLACLMVAVKALARSGVRLRGTLVFGAEVGEDGGGWKFQELLDGPGRCDFGICGEPTNLELHIGCRGSYPLRLRTIGRATHTGTAYRGVNAIQKMCKVIDALYALPCFHRTDPIWDRAPINAMTIQGGGKVTSSVPDECIVQFDIRLNPDLPPEQIDAMVRSELNRLQAEDPDLRVEVQIGRGTGDAMANSQPARSLAPDHPFVETVRQAIEVATGSRPRIAGFPGGCSAAIMLQRGIPAVIFGPGNLEQAHSDAEWIAVDQLHQAARAYAAIAYRILAA